MTYLDDLLDSEVSQDAARAVTPPPFETLHRRGVRRRQRRRASVLGGAALATVAVVVGVQLTDGESTGRPVDVPPPTTPSVPEDALSPAEVVDHPGARLRELVVAPGDEQTRAAMWQVCLDEGCSRTEQAIAVTGDGFETRSEIAVPGHAYATVTPLDDDSFYVGWNRNNQFVVHADGTTTPVRLYDAVPMSEESVVVRTPSPRDQFIRLDLASGQAHPVSVPEGVHQVERTPDGVLYGATSAKTGAGSAVWSADGGATWQEQTLPTHEHPLLSLVPSARPDVLAVVEGADGATLLPFLQVHRSLDGGASWETIDVRTDPQAFLGSSGVLPDGRLLVDIAAWSDQRIDRPSAQPVGLHISDGLDWSALSPVDVGEPFTTGNSDERDYELVGMQTTREGVALYARSIESGAPTQDVYVSYDAGSSWEEVEAR